MHSGIYQKPNGTWYIDTKLKIGDKFKKVKISSDAHGKPYLSKRECDRDYEEAIARWIKEHDDTDSSDSFNSIFEEWVESRRREGLAESTIDNFYYDYNGYFKEFFDKRSIKECLSERYMARWVNYVYDRTDVQGKKINGIMTRMKQLLHYMYMHKYISADTYQDCDVLCVKKRNTEFIDQKKNKIRCAWNDEEISKFINALDKDKIDYLQMTLYLHLGTRIGEFVALRVEDFDFDKNEVSISHQIDHRNKETLRLKNKRSYRTIKLSSEVSNAIRDYVIESGLQPSDYLFHTSTGKNYTKNNFLTKLHKLTCKAGIRDNDTHGLRKTCESHLMKVCRTEEEIGVVARRLGHSPKTAMNVYAEQVTSNLEENIIARKI